MTLNTDTTKYCTKDFSSLFPQIGHAHVHIWQVIMVRENTFYWILIKDFIYLFIYLKLNFIYCSKMKRLQSVYHLKFLQVIYFVNLFILFFKISK